MMNRKFVSRFFIFVLIFILLALLTSIAMLIWYFVTCSSNPCPTTISSTSSETITTLSSFSSSSSSTMTMKTTTLKKRNYRETCEHIDDCHTDFGLLCQYGWEQRKSCLCEGSHYWSIQQNKCRKLLSKSQCLSLKFSQFERVKSMILVKQIINVIEKSDLSVNSRQEHRKRSV